MLRNILAAVAGYLAMALSVFVLFSLLWAVLGSSGSFQPGSWEISDAWTAGSIVVGFAAAYLGGLVCARLARDRGGATILIAAVVALGVVVALAGAGGEGATGPRPDQVSMMEAMSSARQPTWIAWLNPLLGAVGVWIGSWRLRA